MLTVAAGAAFVTGFLVVCSTVVVRDRLLSADFYAAALAENDVYNRVYREVLADPELAAVTDRLLGGLRPAGLDPAEVRAVSTSALRWAVPPATLQEAAESLVEDIVGYARGDRAQLTLRVDVGTVVDRVGAATALEVRALLAATGEYAIASEEEYRAAVEAFALELAAGRIPAAVPVWGGTLVDPGLVAEVAAAALGPGPAGDEHRQIAAAALAGDEREALVVAATGLVADHAATTAREVGAGAPGRHVDLLPVLARRSGRSSSELGAGIDRVRTAARWLNPLTKAGGAGLILAGGVGLLAANWSRPRRAAVAAGSACLVAGTTAAAGWWAVRAGFGSPLAAGTAGGPGSWRLPTSVRAVLTDVDATLAAKLTRAVLVPAGWAMLVGSVVVVVAVAAALRPWRRLPPPRLLLSVSGAVLLAVAAAAWNAPGVTGDDVRRCNGSVELCNRRYDEVVYAAAHNAYASADRGFLWASHDLGIRAQLDMGVRALLLDAHRWPPLVDDPALGALAAVLSRGMFAQLVPDEADLRTGRPGAFLCHSHCAFGATPLVEGLEEIRLFLDDNPHEVVTLFFQDTIDAATTEAVFATSGLIGYVHTHERGSAWPTLGALVEAGERLVVFSEAVGPPPAWYHRAFDLVQDTPYRFAAPDELSCDTHRGPPEASLFLMNHWVRRLVPDRVDAAVVNRADVIVDRARRCEEQRGRRPNFVAVDFVSIGGLLEAVDILNGVE